MNRHSRIFWGIFCWISVVVCVVLSVLNGIATPASRSGALFFAAVGVVMFGAGVYVFRDRHRA